MAKKLHPLSAKIIEYCAKSKNYLSYAIDKEKPKGFVLAPASPTQMKTAEKELGISFHPLHRRLLMEVANGHFGPGYGLYGVPPFVEMEHCKYLKQNLVDEYRSRKKYWWPEGLIPLCYWGCTVISAMYVPDGRIVRFDYSDLDCDYVYFEDKSLENWIGAWVKEVDTFDYEQKPLAKFP